MATRFSWNRTQARYWPLFLPYLNLTIGKGSLEDLLWDLRFGPYDFTWKWANTQRRKLSKCWINRGFAGTFLGLPQSKVWKNRQHFSRMSLSFQLRNPHGGKARKNYLLRICHSKFPVERLRRWGRVTFGSSFRHLMFVIFWRGKKQGKMTRNHGKHRPLWSPGTQEKVRLSFPFCFTYRTE